jgi:hypothetical protein
MPFRNLLAISKQSLGHIGIDSSMMHGAAIFKKPQLNFWGGTHKDNLGYEYSGVINAFNKQGMHGRPVLQLYDRAGVFPFKDKGDGKEFDYQNEEIEKYLNKFLLEITAT